MPERRHNLVLRRIKSCIEQIGRLMENEKFEDGRRLANNCLINLRRIKPYLARDKYMAMESSLTNIIEYCKDESTERVNTTEHAYSAERHRSGGNNNTYYLYDKKYYFNYLI